MFHSQGGYPDVAGGNGGPLSPQLQKELGSLARGRLGGTENGDAGPIEESSQDTVVRARPGAAQKAGAQFGQDDGRQEDLSGRLKPFDRIGHSGTEVAI